MRSFKSIIIIFCFLCNSCGFYSFTGASVSSASKTVSVDYFINKANTVQPTLSQVFTEKLKDYFLEQTNLNLSIKDGDLKFSGEIVKYEITPVDIRSNETAGQNRLSISVSVTFENKQDIDRGFKKIFSRYRNYDSSLNISDIETILIEEIVSELVEDIFNKALVNW